MTDLRDQPSSQYPRLIAAEAAAARSSDDVAALLQSRLRTLAGLLVTLAALLALLGAVGGLFATATHIGWPIVWGAALGTAGLVGLAPHRRMSLARLRAWETIALASGVSLYLAGWSFLLVKLPSSFVATLLTFDDQMGPQIISTCGSIFWVSTMIAYGVYIPNTWRRCAVVIGLMSLCALVPDYFIIRHWPVPSSFFWSYFGGRLFWLVDGSLLAIYGARRIEALRADAAAARKLGQYILTKPLGGGGMGEVYLAEHQFLRRPCAVKLIRPGQVDPTALSRFEREVQTTATLTHPNAIQIFDYGRADDGTFFYAMEYLPGLSLEQLVESEGPMATTRAIYLLRQICGPLEEAHRLGLIHRDIKPGNVIVCERGGMRDVAKLLDFGLVATIGRNDSQPDAGRLTQAGTIVGSPAFMSPEQCGGDDLTPATDIYSMGALAFFLVTGQAPFANRSATQMLAAHIYEKPVAPSSVRPQVAATFDALVLRCLAKDASERFGSAAALEQALAACLDVSEPVAATPRSESSH